MRTETSIVAETAQCFSTHHVALLVGYGAHAICPYLAFETCRQWRSSSRSAALLSLHQDLFSLAPGAAVTQQKLGVCPRAACTDPGARL